jgi:hypothetical protein
MRVPLTLRFNVRIGLVLASCALAGQVHAAGPATPFTIENAIAAAMLDDYRGGFVTDTGLAVTLGLERIVTINGNLADSSKIDFGDLGRLTTGQATLSDAAAGQLRLIQNGAASNVSVALGNNALGGTIIQNTLNNQLINNQTIINASVNARGMLQAMNFQSSLANALYTAANGR